MTTSACMLPPAEATTPTLTVLGVNTNIFESACPPIDEKRENPIRREK
ncbi:MAG: hypothetical protein QXO49_02055 [Candidatus Bathyarchaeia archaeon]